MTDLEKAISDIETSISNINEELEKIDKDSTDFAEIEKRFEYKIALKNDRYIYQHALDLLKEHKSLNNK